MNISPSRLILFVVTAALFLPSGWVRAQDASESAESRLRDALRSTMLQLRDAQNQVATAQATQAQSDKDNADLKAKVDALNAQVATLTKQAADDKAAADKAIADLKAQNADQATQIGKLNDALAAWEKDDKRYQQIAKDKEGARAQLAGQVLVLHRTIDDREMKNVQLYDLANEILTRYEKYGLGEALLAKEPFVGITRVQLQELVQDYRDKISDQRVSPGKSLLLPVPAATAPGATPPAHAEVSEQKTAFTTP